MTRHTDLRVETEVGIINLLLDSILDYGLHVIPRLLINRVLIVGELPTEKEFVRKLKLLRLMTTPHMLLPYTEDGAQNPEWRLRTSSLLKNFVLTEQWYAKEAPWSGFLKPFIQKGAVSFNFDEFKSKRSGPVEPPQACDNMIFGTALRDADVKYLMGRCQGKINTITLAEDERRPLDVISPSLSLLTNNLILSGVTLDRVAESISTLLRNPNLSIHIELCEVVNENLMHQVFKELKDFNTFRKQRLKIDRMVLWFVPSKQKFFDMALVLAQTVFVTIGKDIIQAAEVEREVESASKLGARYYLVPRPEVKATARGLEPLAEAMKQKRVVWSIQELWDGEPPENKIYPWIKGDAVTFVVKPSPPTDREIKEFQAMCPQVRHSIVEDASHPAIILTMANMTTETLVIRRVQFNNDYKLIAHVLNLKKRHTFKILSALVEINMAYPFGEIPNDRFEVSTMVLSGLPDTEREYRRVLDAVLMIAIVVYQYMNNDTRLDWLSVEKINGFVIDPAYDYKPLLRVLNEKNIRPNFFDTDSPVATIKNFCISFFDEHKLLSENRKKIAFLTKK